MIFGGSPQNVSAAMESNAGTRIFVIVFGPSIAASGQNRKEGPGGFLMPLRAENLLRTAYND
jgi:hypothetical protein